MAKAAPSKKTAKAAKTASTGAKKTRKHKRVETFNLYIHKVLKQVHPGACFEARGAFVCVALRRPLGNPLPRCLGGGAGGFWARAGRGA